MILSPGEKQRKMSRIWPGERILNKLKTWSAAFFNRSVAQRYFSLRNSASHSATLCG
jgi:hypothetical protein